MLNEQYYGKITSATVSLYNRTDSQLADSKNACMEKSWKQLMKIQPLGQLPIYGNDTNSIDEAKRENPANRL